MIYFCDIDGILCTNTNGEYEKTEPIEENIARLNTLHALGHTIILWTARGAETGLDWRILTENQMDEWGVSYHELRLDKPFYDKLIDDKSENWAVLH